MIVTSVHVNSHSTHYDYLSTKLTKTVAKFIKMLSVHVLIIFSLFSFILIFECNSL